MRFFTSTVLLVVLAGCAVLINCSRQANSGITINKTFKPLIRPETDILAGISLDKLKVTPLYKRHEKELDFPLLDASVQRLGFDPRRDLTDLLFASHSKDGVLMAQGSFQPKDIEAKLQASGLQRSTYRGVTVLGDSRNALAFIKSGVLLAAPPQLLKSDLDFGESGAGEVPEELQERLRTLPTSDQIWIVSRGGLPFADLATRSDVQSVLSNIVAYIRGVTAGVAADNGMHLLANLTCQSKEGAQRVHDAIRGGIGFLRLSTKDNETEMLKLYDAIQVDQDQNLVKVHADLSEDKADKLLNMLPPARARSGQL